MPLPGDIKKSRTPPLTTIQNVGIEISRIYRRTKRGELDTPDGYRLVQMLAVLKQCLETCEVERRLDEIEALVAGRQLAEKQGSFKPKLVS